MNSAEISNPHPPQPGEITGTAATPAPSSRLHSLCRRPGAWLFVLVLFALCYFASYVRYGINFRDEGGTVALLSKRLLEGQRPFLDVELGYNVLWFYPVVGLFKLFGVNFVLLRAYCFLLSTITAVVGFLTIQRVSRRPWLAFLVGLLLVLVPGMTFKNYMPLMAVCNAACLIQFALAGIALRHPRPDTGDEAAPIAASPVGRAWGWLIIGSVVLGVSFLIRVDIGTFFTILWLAAIGLSAWDPVLSRRARLAQLFLAPLLLLAIVAAIHFPVWQDAQRRGFDTDFVAQYIRTPKNTWQRLVQRFGAQPAPTTPSVAAPPQSSALDEAAKIAAPPPVKEPSAIRSLLPRLTWQDFLHAKKSGEQMLFILLYAPFLILTPLILWALIRLKGALKLGDSETLRRSLAALLAVGGALTDFPQYFFFRPDAPHLSEFSPGYWVATVAACLLLGAHEGTLRNWRRWPARLLFVLLLAHAGAYLYEMLPDRWTGTIAARYKFSALTSREWMPTHWAKALAARDKHTALFHGANGVDVFLTKSEFEGLTALVKVIDDHARADDNLLVYPYHPAINLITDRATYEIDLYIDNATHSKTWEAGAIARLNHFQPAVIVLSDWAINGTPDSRFSVWAARTKAWIQAHYDFQGKYMDREEFEVYTRKPAPTPPTPPAATPAATEPTAAPAAPAPVSPAPAPLPSEPAPVPAQPVPTPASPESKPAPAVPTPVPPAPVPSEPAPAPAQPTPTPASPESKPAPAVPTPVPPAPIPSEPAPAPAQPAPTPASPESKPTPPAPTPVPSEPAPAPAQPAPTPASPESKPAPPAPTPVPPTPPTPVPSEPAPAPAPTP